MRTPQDQLIERVSEVLAAEKTVDAVWLGGSLGRGDGDALSDVDIAVVIREGHEAEVVGARFDIAARVANVALTLDSPQNSHPAGAQVNVLYDVHPLPTYVDWNFWPPMTERPSGIRVLFERDPSRFVDGRSYDEIQTAMPRGRPPALTAEYLDHFRLAMLPVVAKLAARGATDDVLRMFDVIREPRPSEVDMPTVVSTLLRLLDRVAANEPPVAAATVRRYLEVIQGLDL